MISVHIEMGWPQESLPLLIDLHQMWRPSLGSLAAHVDRASFALQLDRSCRTGCLRLGDLIRGSLSGSRSETAMPQLSKPDFPCVCALCPDIPRLHVQEDDDIIGLGLGPKLVRSGLERWPRSTTHTSRRASLN